MITIRKRLYLSENNKDVTFTRLGLDVEEVDVFFVDSQIGHDITVETKKRWIGKIERTNGTFEILKPNASILPMRILEGNIYNLYVLGKVSNEGHKSRIEVHFAIGYLALLGLALICLAPIIGLVSFMIDDKLDEMNKIIPFIIFFTIPGTLILLFQMNGTEGEVKNSLGVH